VAALLKPRQQLRYAPGLPLADPARGLDAAFVQRRCNGSQAAAPVASMSAMARHVRRLDGLATGLASLGGQYRAAAFGLRVGARLAGFWAPTRPTAVDNRFGAAAGL